MDSLKLAKAPTSSLVYASGQFANTTSKNNNFISFILKPNSRMRRLVVVRAEDSSNAEAAESGQPVCPMIRTTKVEWKLKQITAQPETKNINLIPGPSKLPVIGNIHQIAGKLIHSSLRDLANVYGPVMHLMLGEISTVVISSPEAAMEVMKTHDVNFASRPNIIAADIMAYGSTDLLFSPHGPYWRQLRKLAMMELLSGKRVQMFHSIRQDEVLKVINAISNRGSSPMNLSSMLHDLSSDITARAAFGNKCNDKETYLSAMAEALKFGLGFSAADLFPSSRLVRYISGIDAKLGKCFQTVDSILDRIIEEHKEWRSSKGGEDSGAAMHENLLDVMLRLREEGGTEIPLTTTTIKALLFDVFQVGTGSSASTLTWAMSELMKNPRVMKKAQKEIRDAINNSEDSNISSTDLSKLNYFNMVVKEVLRLHPAAPLLVPRVCTKSSTVQGYEIPEKTRVIINAWAIARSPKYWNNPEEFIPERFENNGVDFKGTHFEFIPFGAGRRMCPGMSFGVTTIEFALANLLYHFDWSLPDGMKTEDLDMTEIKGLAARKKENLIVCAKPNVSRG